MASALSPDQIQAYVEHIGLPAKYHPSADPQRDLAFLTALTVHVISTIPYDNLSLHYSPTKKISIDPQDAFRKIVTEKRGRGGCKCTQNQEIIDPSTLPKGPKPPV